MNLEADSRIESGGAVLPAVGWDQDFARVNGVLNLPPGWRLFHARGVDDVRSTWITSWSLLDLFLVLITALAVGQLWGWAWGALALVGLVLSYPEPGAPRWAWLAVLAGVALIRGVPAGRLLPLLKLYRLGALAILIMLLGSFGRRLGDHRSHFTGGQHCERQSGRRLPAGTGRKDG